MILVAFLFACKRREFFVEKDYQVITALLEILTVFHSRGSGAKNEVGSVRHGYHLAVEAWPAFSRIDFPFGRRPSC
jgi:hypothetical protein